MTIDDRDAPSTVKLYKKREDGTIELLTMSRTMFPDQDAFVSALDTYYADGYYDSAVEARENNYFTSDSDLSM